MSRCTHMGGNIVHFLAVSLAFECQLGHHMWELVKVPSNKSWFDKITFFNILWKKSRLKSTFKVILLLSYLASLFTFFVKSELQSYKIFRFWIEKTIRILIVWIFTNFSWNDQFLKPKLHPPMNLGPYQPVIRMADNWHFCLW